MNFRQYKGRLRRQGMVRKRADWHQCPDCGMPVGQWQMECPSCGSQDVFINQWPMVEHPTEPPLESPQVPDTVPQDFERPSLYGPMPQLPSNPDDSSSGLTVPEHFQQGDMISPQEISEFMAGYFEAALWTSSLEEYADFANEQEDKDEDDPHAWASDQSLLDYGFTVDDIDPGSAAEATQEARNFINDNAPDLNAYAEELGWSQAGHDFWLTRNRHGTGYWDRGLGPVGDRLAKAAKIYGESYMHAGSDGKVYIQ